MGSRKRIRIRITRKGVNLNHLLPHELISDILSRLPITSLPQLKLTCKLWNSLLVDDPSFPSKHLSHALKAPGHLYTLIDHPNFYFAQNQSVAVALPRQVPNDDLGEDTLYLSRERIYYVIEYASCHGLVCHSPYMSQSIHVFNPIIKEHVRLPDRPLPTTLRWGFGFAPITRKYKFYCYSTAKLDHQPPVFSSAVYTLGHNESWREISCPPYPLTITFYHVYSKGALYWAIHDNYIGYSLVSLDLETETFRERRIDFDHGTQGISLAVVGETVATVARVSTGLKVFFLMDEDRDFWEPKYTIPYAQSPRVLVGMKCLYLLNLMGLWMNRDLYFSERVLDLTSRPIYDVKCFFFGPGENKFSEFCFPFPKDVRGKIIPQLILSHVGSLVSPIKIMKARKQQLTNLS